MNTNNCILHIKNMVCPRCKYIVTQIFEDLGCHLLAVELGQVVIRPQNIPSQQQIEERLKENGFELLTFESARLVERVKVLLINLLYWSREVRWPIVLEEYLEVGMQTEFKELDRLFLSIGGCSIREYFNLLRFERSKELVSYNELSIQHIAKQLGYGSSETLSLEFSRRLDLEIPEFIHSADKYRLSLDSIG
jgi:AraC-like DNA-binding protein